VPIVLRTGSLNLLEPSGLSRAVMGLLYLLHNGQIASVSKNFGNNKNNNIRTCVRSSFYVSRITNLELLNLLKDGKGDQLAGLHIIWNSWRKHFSYVLNKKR
jgi:hypothetical protein